MVLNASLALGRAFKSSAMFARKVDPGLYRDVLWEWRSMVKGPSL